MGARRAKGDIQRLAQIAGINRQLLLLLLVLLAGRARESLPGFPHCPRPSLLNLPGPRHLVQPFDPAPPTALDTSSQPSLKNTGPRFQDDPQSRCTTGKQRIPRAAGYNGPALLPKATARGRPRGGQKPGAQKAPRRPCAEPPGSSASASRAAVSEHGQAWSQRPARRALHTFPPPAAPAQGVSAPPQHPGRAS